MKRLFLSVLTLPCVVTLVAAEVAPTKFDFPIYKNTPPGKQVGGVRAATATEPLPAAEAQKRFKVPDGFEVRLFATEPEVVNPVTMTWDSRGRLWVLELYDYPLGAPKGQKGRDRIKILEDTDADGRADKVHVWADGLSLATGLLLGNGGAYVGQAPHLLFLKDTDGDDRADTREVVMTGFGLEDRHELLNGFTWGPDGYLYMTHGVFTRSKVKNPDDPNDDGIYVDAAVARWHPRTKKFEVFADGTSNPWGVDFDYAGNAFISACVIDHMWHMAPGGQYLRQGGTWPNPYGYADMHSQRGGLPSIVDHRHHMAAYCGIQIYQGNQYPAEHLGTVLCGNIHDNSVHQDVLTSNGSSFKSSFKQDFVRANDGWFRPTTQLVGPDGAIWISDWYDKYPCYQNARADPAGVDREYGRIWRVVYTGKQKGKLVPSRPERDMDVAGLSSIQLLKLLEHDNIWQRRQAARLLDERREPGSQTGLLRLLNGGRKIEHRLLALWTLHNCGQLTDKLLDTLGSDSAFEIRAWVARLTGERAIGNDQTLARLQDLAQDDSPVVRLAVATAARQFVSGQLTVNTPPPATVDNVSIKDLLATLIQSSQKGDDPLIPFLIWMAAEPVVVASPAESLGWLRDHGEANLPLSGHITHKAVRRVCDLPGTTGLDRAVGLVGELRNDSGLLVHALRGIAAGMKGRAESPTVATEDLIARLLKHSDKEVRGLAQRLGSQWGNASAMEKTISVIADASASVADRVKAVQATARLKNKSARDSLVAALGRKNPEPLTLEVIRALGPFGLNELPDVFLDHWSGFSPNARRASVEVLASRDRWASSLLSALEQKKISRDDVPVTAMRTLLRSGADFGMLAKRAGQVFGKVRDADKDKAKLIAAKKNMILGSKAKADLKRGRELATLICLTCHKLHDEGTDLEIGPNLTGAGRSTLDALLANIIDPNQIIGAGYEMTEVVTKDGQTLNGRVVENSATRIRLLAAGPREEVVAKAGIKSMMTSELSLMPEGLAEQMSDDDFRNLVAYILNPPGDQQPFSWKNVTTDALVNPKTGGNKTAGKYPRIDWESVSHWNPDWHVVAPEFEGTPVKLADYEGRKDVLRTHPYDREKASGIEREINVAKEGKTALNFWVAASEKGDWELRVLADGKPIHRQTVDQKAERWKQVNVDLSSFAGRKVKLRLENAANGWSWEFGHWAGIEVRSGK